jgi:hypothetical protein
MARSAEEMEELRLMCPGAREMQEGGITYVFLPELKHPCAPGVIDALLCPQQHTTGYTTRLFLSAVVPGKCTNWSTHSILSRTWHTWSWNNVLASQRLAEILVQHLRALR